MAPPKKASQATSTQIQELKTLKELLTNQLILFTEFLKNFEDSKLNLLKQKLSRAENWCQEFKDLYVALAHLISDEQKSILKTELMKFEEDFDEAICLAKSLIPSPKITSSFIEGDSHSRNETRIEARIKLPTLNLPRFEGSYEGWTEFVDSFDGIVHSNVTLTPSQKLQYLKSAVHGEAAKVIQTLKVSDSNYPIAWSLLRTRYERKNLIVKGHLRAIFNTSKMFKESVSQLRTISDTIVKSLRGLESIGISTSNWDPWLIYLVTERLDDVTLREWESSIDTDVIPTWQHMEEFLNKRCGILEALSRNSSNSINKTPKKMAFSVTNPHCALCNQTHAIFDCPMWLTLTATAKSDTVKRLKLCFRCLTPWTFRHKCKAKCSKCSGFHHVLLHVEPSTMVSQVEPTVSQVEPMQVALTAHTCSEQVLLSTVEVMAKNIDGKYEIIRALLDPGSQSSFMTTELTNKLRLPKMESNMTVMGINNANCRTSQLCNVEVKSRLSQFSLTIVCAVMNEICGNLPNKSFNPSAWKFPRGIDLADPQFHQPRRIDMLIGADYFWQLLCPGFQNLGLNLPTLQNTHFGYIVSGPLGTNKYSDAVKCNFSANLEIQEQLEKFWKEEECTSVKQWTNEELMCEEHYKKTTIRNKDGRFVVRIPLKEDVSQLGDSRTQAERRFLALEHKLAKNPILRQRYVDFMSEYESLGHMQRVEPSKEDKCLVAYYAPHHGVLKEESLTTKLRVVFDCSAKSTSGVSVNDLQMVGPTVQEDLLSLILRFRLHAFVVTADIAKMYRQVLVDPAQHSLQRILWRYNSNEPISAWELKTVTYGTAAASFLAIRSIHALAELIEEYSPIVANTMKRDFYVDDLLTGGDDREELLLRCKEVSNTLKSGCFELRKWNSNDKNLLSNINRESQPEESLDLGENQGSKTLGLIWNTNTDSLMFRIKSYTDYEVITKRIMLARISQIFDPLGLLSPCTIIAKVMLQKLWLEKIDWDDKLPTNLACSWIALEKDLPSLNLLKVPRRVSIGSRNKLQLHGFSDASEAAFGACVYVLSSDSRGTYTQLLCSKSKVSPLKRVTIPRLQLCGAVLLVRLIKKIIGSWKSLPEEVILWTDSTTVLSWIQTEPAYLKTYVGNRVAEIQGLEHAHQWRYVPTADNPADLISRGVFPSKILNLELWWNGPNWLSKDSFMWPAPVTLTKNVPEIRVQANTFFARQSNDVFPFLKYSSFEKLKRVFAYMLRFVKNSSSAKELRVSGPLSCKELNKSFQRLVLLSQRESFIPEFKSLNRNSSVIKGSKLYGLNPFIDDDGLIRVGGRLNEASFSMDKKHPIVLCSKHPLTCLIFEAEHKRMLHPGPQLLLSFIRQKIWPISGRNLAKKTVDNCVRCFRTSPKGTNPLMGNLPAQRISAKFAFENVGIDYAGPILIKDRKGRGAKSTKHYMCLFVCLAVKAVHLELVSDLTTEAFIAALRRFISRRGKPHIVYSDNGTNFVGAKTELKELASFLKSSGRSITELAANEEIEWKFIPARSPHHGGLWERAVRSAKHHLRRITGNSLFTYEEYLTLLIQVEAVLNSRPLCPLSCDPNDLEPITPSHFLVGHSLTALPDEPLLDVGRLSRFQHVQFVLQHFWNRWSREYVPELQPRNKWRTGDSGILLGSLVLIRDENLPPLKWKLGRVCEIHPGKDDVIRVVSVKTSSGIVKRSTAKLCLLPMQL